MEVGRNELAFPPNPVAAILLTAPRIFRVQHRGKRRKCTEPFSVKADTCLKVKEESASSKTKAVPLTPVKPRFND